MKQSEKCKTGKEDRSKLIEEIFNENPDIMYGNDGIGDDFIRPDLNKKIKSSGKFSRMTVR